MTQWIQARDVAGLLRPGMTVFVAGGTAEPREIIDALSENGESCAGVRFVSISLPGINHTDFTTLGNQTQSTAFFATRENRESIAAGRTEFIPLQYSAIFDYLEHGLPIDIALVQLPKPGNTGVRHGISVDFLPAVLDKADVVIGEINARQPTPQNAPEMSLARLNYAVACDRPVPTLEQHETSATVTAIGAHIAGLISDGDCIQIGIGGIPGATLAALSGRNDLGFHSGMISDGAMALARAGNITGRMKSVDKKMMVSGATLGSQELVDWAGSAPNLAFRPVGYTHNADVLRRIDHFVSINAALEVDLFGQTNADMLGGRQISATGGAIDMMRGAALSRGGRSIIALKATAKGGEISCIRPALTAQTATTALRTDVDYVVTEFGARRIRYLPLMARAEALIEIAHPDFRGQLRDQWKDMRKEMMGA
jgi:4-hydroxybutyrate CoA-transferase